MADGLQEAATLDDIKTVFRKEIRKMRGSWAMGMGDRGRGRDGI